MLNFRKTLCLIGMFFLSNSSFAYHINQKSANELGKAYGFLYGQDISLDFINRNYPQLSNDVFIAKSNFNSAFPNIKENIKDILLSVDKEKATEALAKGVTQGGSQFSATQNNISKSDAVIFLNLVNERAKGQIESPILETMLAVQYDDNPIHEMTDGFYNRYSSSDNKKSKGIEVNLKLPKSWKQIEAGRPNIVNQWVSQNGNGNSYIMLMVKDAEGINLSLTEIQNLFDSGEISNLAIDGLKVNSGYPIVLEGQNGLHFKMNGISTRLNLNIYEIAETYGIFYNGKYIAIQCMTGDIPNNKLKVDLQYQKVEPLCKYVANSLTLPQKYN